MHFGTAPWAIMGADALKPTYSQEMRSFPHIICSRGSYEIQPPNILTGKYVKLTTLPRPLHLLREDIGDDVWAIIYDKRIGSFHYALGRSGQEWPSAGRE